MAAAGAAERRIAHDDPVLRHRGAVSLERGPGWTAPWRLPHHEAELYLPEGGTGRAAMPSGVRITFRTDSPSLRCRYQADPPPRLDGPPEWARLDVVCAGRAPVTVELAETGRDEEFRVAGLPGTMTTVELWLPFYHRFRLRGLSVAAGAAVEPDRDDPPRWLHCGSSVSQGRGAASPSRTWAALVARRRGWDLTSLALGASDCLQPMTARLMRELPAELITLCVGVNAQALGSHNRDSLVSALVGFVRTVREGHPHTPFGVMSPIVAPERERVPGPSGMTMRECRARVRRAVELLRDHGDHALYHLDGMEVFGASCTGLMLEPAGGDRLHPAPAGHPVFAARFATVLRRAGCVPAPGGTPPGGPPPGPPSPAVRSGTGRSASG
ncbi:G-D-S-L family lipolytic protein [Streptomyces pactum]|uniref:G-D-S-L family lipolytic protein n=1 Tax=Streptomyces pactum TaxID=68249 RepID=A0ABS0NED3_9ACTN|nr:GDSL-type esterase/lipase family protein [Streptomyces pactum]MBH5333555.1 G-D-S-L family lipolytic protein [Streptomyces pactum]